jgi:recombination protein RecA
MSEEKNIKMPGSEAEAKNKMVTAAMEQIKSKYGDGSIMKFGEARTSDVDVVSTGCLSLDIALGVGGVPRGRIIEIFGPEASGKTTLAQHIVAEAQKLGGICAFVDAEHALDPEYATKIGVNVKDLIISQPDTGEQALEIVETLVRSNAIDVIVIDSVAPWCRKKKLREIWAIHIWDCKRA